MTLEDYLRLERARGAENFSIHTSEVGGVIKFYIHCSHQDSNTLDYEIRGNKLTQFANEHGNAFIVL